MRNVKWRKVFISAVIANRWRCAIAYHLYILAHISLFSGENRKAFVIATKLREFDDIISERDVYSLLALTSRVCEVYSMCSKSFVKLISSTQVTTTENNPKCRGIKIEFL